MMTFLYAYLALYLLWVLYLAVMNLRRVKDSLHPVAKAHAIPVLFIGAVLDWVLNMTVMTLAFWELPAHRTELITGRLKRYHGPAYAGSRRAVAADWLCTHMLDQFDPSGDHC